MFRTQEIFITERGIFAHGYAAGIDARAREYFNVEIFHLYRAAEGIFQTSNEVIANARSVDGNRGGDLGGHEKDGHPKRNLPRIPQIGHDQKFRRLRHKCVGAEGLERCSRSSHPFGH